MVLGPLLSQHLSMSTDRGEDGDDGEAPSVPDAPSTPAADAAAPDQPPAVDASDPAASVTPVQRRRSRLAEPRPSLQPPLLSGRSLEGPRRGSRFEVVRQNRVLVLVVLVVLVVLGVVLGGKLLAERAADRAMTSRSEDLLELLDGARPEDFLAFGASVQQDGSLAQRVRDTDGFVNVRAGAELAFIRFQPSGWWAGFTERCLVARVGPEGPVVEVPNLPCNRVEVPPT
jgi:hypothetical protein